MGAWLTVPVDKTAAATDDSRQSPSHNNDDALEMLDVTTTKALAVALLQLRVFYVVSRHGLRARQGGGCVMQRAASGDDGRGELAPWWPRRPQVMMGGEDCSCGG